MELILYNFGRGKQLVVFVRWTMVICNGVALTRHDN